MTMNDKRSRWDLRVFKWSPVCACDLPAPCIDIIIASVSAEFSRLEVLEMEGMIIIGLVLLEKCNGKVDEKYFVRLGLTGPDDHFLDPTGHVHSTHHSSLIRSVCH